MFSAKLARICRTPPARHVHHLSRSFVPFAKESAIDGQDDGLGALLRAGFIRQSSAGIWSLLPNGLKVQSKIEAIIDQEMATLHAQKISLPNLLNSRNWEASGRWITSGSELFRLKDRKGSDFLLGPTHEEEITALVAQEVTSYKRLPIRLYQIGRKFRDEARPRAGLLRGREFNMKDLYTFDTDPQTAQASYKQVREAYNRIFERIGLRFYAAEADSGNIGGDTSHEYLYESAIGEDTLVTCSKCDYAANVEVARSFPDPTIDREEVVAQALVSPNKDLYLVLVPKSRPISKTKLAKHIPVELAASNDLKATIEDMQGCNIILDESCEIAIKDMKWVLSQFFDDNLAEEDAKDAHRNPMIWTTAPDQFDISESQPGDKCVKCAAPLKTSTAIEVGHTFYLGTRYTLPLKANYVPSSGGSPVPIEMGCYGIGITRLIGAIAEACCDSKGLAWPFSLAPFSVAVIPTNDKIQVTTELLNHLDAQLGSDQVLIDDRPGVTFGSKMKDAELAGYTSILVLGKKWAEHGIFELHCRRSGANIEAKNIEEITTQIQALE